MYCATYVIFFRSNSPRPAGEGGRGGGVPPTGGAGGGLRVGGARGQE